MLARTVSGEITLAGLGGPAEAETVGRGAGLRRHRGPVGPTVSGDLTVAEGGGGSVRARTVSGAIALDLGPSGERDIRLSSVSGDLTVRLPGASDLEVKLDRPAARWPAPSRSWSTSARRPARGPGPARRRHRPAPGDQHLRHVALLRRAPEASERRVGEPGGAPMSPVFSHGRLRLYLLKLLEEPAPRLRRDPAARGPLHGPVRPSPGTIYAAPAPGGRGLVTQTKEGGRKVYRDHRRRPRGAGGRRRRAGRPGAEIAGSVHGLAREIRDEVRGTVRDLKQELKQAAREIRREQRHENRSPRPLRPVIAGTGRRGLRRPPGEFLDRTQRAMRQAQLTGPRCASARPSSTRPSSASARSSRTPANRRAAPRPPRSDQ